MVDLVGEEKVRSFERRAAGGSCPRARRFRHCGNGCPQLGIRPRRVFQQVLHKIPSRSVRTMRSNASITALASRPSHLTCPVSLFALPGDLVADAVNGAERGERCFWLGGQRKTGDSRRKSSRRLPGARCHTTSAALAGYGSRTRAQDAAKQAAPVGPGDTCENGASPTQKCKRICSMPATCLRGFSQTF